MSELGREEGERSEVGRESCEGRNNGIKIRGMGVFRGRQQWEEEPGEQWGWEGGIKGWIRTYGAGIKVCKCWRLVCINWTHVPTSRAAIACSRLHSMRKLAHSCRKANHTSRSSTGNILTLMNVIPSMILTTVALLFWESRISSKNRRLTEWKRDCDSTPTT